LLPVLDAVITVVFPICVMELRQDFVHVVTASKSKSIDGVQEVVAPKTTSHRFVVILEADAVAPRKDTDGILEALSKRGGNSMITPSVYRWSRGDVPANFVAGLKLGPFARCLSEQVSPQFCVLVRVNPESLVNNPNFDEDEFWHFVQELNEQYSTTVMSDPNVMVKLADKRILTSIGNQIWYGLRDTQFYSNREELVTGLNVHMKNAAATANFSKNTMTTVERVLKMNRGRSGESVIKFTFSSSRITYNELDKPDEPPHHFQSVHELLLMSDSDRTKLFPFENGISWIDMRFLPHITDGEVRLIMDGNECISVMQRPNSGALCAKAGSPWSPVQITNNVAEDLANAEEVEGVSYVCSSVEADRLRMAFVDSLPKLKEILQIEDAVLPPLWTADFIRNDLMATGDNNAVPWILGEFNAMSTGYTAFGSDQNPRTMQVFGNAMAKSIERRFGIINDET
jgi:hypothetical protein